MKEGKRRCDIELKRIYIGNSYTRVKVKEQVLGGVGGGCCGRVKWMYGSVGM